MLAKSTSIRTCRLAGVSFFAFVAIYTFVQPAAAQVAINNKNSETSIFNVLIPAPREDSRPLSVAKRALEEGQFNEAFRALGRVLGIDPDDPLKPLDTEVEDFFVGPFEEPLTQTSLKLEAQKLIGELSPKGRDLFEQRYGHRANNLLKEAVDERDLEKVASVSRLYFHTKAGYEATFLIGTHHLDEGRPIAAALALQRLTVNESARKRFDPELSLLLATCWVYAEMPEKAEGVLVQLKHRQPKTPILIGGNEVAFFNADEDALKWLGQVVGSFQPLAHRTPNEWALFGGDAARNSQSSGGMPLSKERWNVRLALLPSDQRAVADIRKQYQDKNWAVMPSLHPLAVGDWVLVRTPDELLGIQFQNGKRTWRYPWEPGTHDSASPRPSGGFSPRKTQLNQRIFDDMPYGHMSSDGEAVYLVNDLGYVMQGSYSQRVLIQAGGIAQSNPHWPREYNTLMSLQLRGEGKARWEVGGSTGGEEEKLVGAFFLGAPLPLFGELYALVEMDAEISLVVLDPATGRLRWRQQVASVESNNIVSDVSRRLAGASPSFADGVLVCPTSSGAVIAMDLSSRTFLWGFQFPRANFTRRFNGFGTTVTTNNRYVGNRWTDSTVTIADGRVILTPVESEKAFCLDLLTGQSQWSGGIDREEMLYLACVTNNNALFVGKTDMRAVQLKNGKQVWRTTFGNGAMPSGRGYLSEGFYYVPTNDAQLLKIDAKTGKIAKRVPTNGVLGNLICYQGDVISLSADYLKVFRQEAPLRAKVEAALKENPDDPWALVRQGELHLLDEDFNQAIVAIRRAHKFSDKDDLDEVRALLRDAMLGAIRKDFAGNADLAKELEPFLDSSEHLANYLQLVARGKQEDGDLLGAFRVYQRLIAMNDANEPRSTSGSTVYSADQASRNADVQQGRWLRARIASLLSEAAAADRAAMDKEIKAHFDQAVQDNSIQELREFAELFATHPLAAEAKVALSDRFLAAEEYLQAEQMLLSLLSANDASIAGQATARLARMLEKSGQSASALRIYGLLARDFADVVCLEGKTGRDLFEDSVNSENLAPYRDVNQKWGAGKTGVEQSGDNVISSPSYLRVYPIQLHQFSDASPQGLQVSFDQRSNAVIVRDGLGETICHLPLKNNDGRNFYTSNYAVTYARAYGHLLLLSVGYDLLAVDLFQAAINADEAILWRVDLTQSVPPPTGQRSTRRRVEATPVTTPWGRKSYRAADEEGNLVGVSTIVSESGLCYLRHSELVCVDPVTGDTLWSRGRINPGSDLFGDDEVVFVVAKNGKQANAFSMIDGSPLGTRDLSAHVSRWSVVGRQLLCWHEKKNGLELELYDPWLKSATWSRMFAPKSKGEIMLGEELAVLQPDGEFMVVSLNNGKVRINAKVQPEPSLASIHMLCSSTHYLLVTNKNEVDYDEPRKIQPAPHGFQTPLVGGRVYAFDRSTGEQVWQVPAEIDQYGLPLDQPADVPVLTFLRHAAPTVERGPRRTQTSILCIDKRDGRILFQRENIPAATHSYKIVGRPSEKAVYITLPGQSFTFRFSDEPVAPEPPAQTGESSSLTADSSEINLGRVANAIMNAFP